MLVGLVSGIHIESVKQLSLSFSLSLSLSPLKHKILFYGSHNYYVEWF